MALFQRAPANAEEVERGKPIDIPPDKVLEMDEEEWYARVYRGDDVPQLTIRAVAVGSVLGFLLAFTNLYIGLKTGWALGVAIMACIISYGVWRVFLQVGFAKTPMTILETNCMQSTASSAGYATGGPMVSAVAAMLMLSASEANPKGEHMSVPVVLAWIFFLAILGTVMAIPMKRNMINRERLKFPSGTAAAVTLQSLYSEGTAALRKAKALMWATIAGAIFPIVLELEAFSKTVTDKASGAVETVKTALLPGHSAIFDAWLPAFGTHVENGVQVANKPSHWTMFLDHNPVMIGAGAIVGLRVTIYMVLGALALAFWVGPAALVDTWQNAQGEVVGAATAPWKAWKEIGIWLGVPIMVSSGLLSFAMQWRTIGRAFRGLGGGTEDDLVKRTEVPIAWFLTGTVVAGLGLVIIAQTAFEVPWYYGTLAVLLTFALALVACRATGESDITPTGAMGKIMQLTYGVLIPQSTTANLMTASITAGSSGSAADLLNDLKSGYLLGANPRRQFIAQFMGIFAGTLATVGGFYLLVPDATTLLGDGSMAPKFPAPAAQAWRAVAEVFKFGLENLHPTHQKAIVWGLIAGAVMVVLERLLPKVKKWLPSATGIGLGFILPFQYPFSMLIGAFIAHLWHKKNPESHEAYMVPTAAGLIAGVSILGVIVATLNTLVFTG